MNFIRDSGSSFNDRNFFEIAVESQRSIGSDGMYKDLALYTSFVVNHDVNRVASSDQEPRRIFSPFTDYFSPFREFRRYITEANGGFAAKIRPGTDADLRPAIFETADQGRHNLFSEAVKPANRFGTIENTIRTFARIRKENRALQSGNYRQLHVASEQFAFIRETENDKTIVVLNSAGNQANVTFAHGTNDGWKGGWRDALDPSYTTRDSHGKISVSIQANGIRILVHEK
jgi:hypothetical protein